MPHGGFLMLSEALAPADADRKSFAQCFNRLAKAKRAKDLDQADMQIYYDTLKAFPLWAIEEAARELQMKPTYGFPPTDVWVQQAEAEVQRRLRETLVHGRTWVHDCETCRDSGWREYICQFRQRCGRHFCDQLGEKHTHTYYGVCPCRSHNPTYQRHTRASQLGHGKAEPK